MRKDSWSYCSEMLRSNVASFSNLRKVCFGQSILAIRSISTALNSRSFPRCGHPMNTSAATESRILLSWLSMLAEIRAYAVLASIFRSPSFSGQFTSLTI